MLSLSLVILSLSGQIGEPRGVRLLEDTPYLAQVPPPPLPPPSAGPGTDAEVSAQQLQVDIDALRRQRPSLGGGIALLASGGGVAILGGFYLAMSTIASFGASSPFLIIGVAGLVIGLPLAVIGVWLLINRLEARKRIDDETSRLRQELQRRGPQPRPYQPYQQQPQLEVPPPQVRGPDSSLLLARF